jgi:ribose 5-phosphate isomerase RpiB
MKPMKHLMRVGIAADHRGFHLKDELLAKLRSAGSSAASPFGSGVGASVCANKIAGIRAALVHDHFSARQGVEDDHMNILCMGGRTVGQEVTWRCTTNVVRVSSMTRNEPRAVIRDVPRVYKAWVARGGETVDGAPNRRPAG